MVCLGVSPWGCLTLVRSSAMHDIIPAVAEGGQARCTSLGRLLCGTARAGSPATGSAGLPDTGGRAPVALAAAVCVAAITVAGAPARPTEARLAAAASVRARRNNAPPGDPGALRWLRFRP